MQRKVIHCYVVHNSKLAHKLKSAFKGVYLPPKGEVQKGKVFLHILPEWRVVEGRVGVLPYPTPNVAKL